MFPKLALLTASALFLSGCFHTGGTQTTGGTTPAPTTGEAMMEKSSVEIKDFAFSPNALTVKAGEKITVCNKDITGHTFTADDGKSFDTPLIGKDQCETVTAPSTPGEYPFHCTPHASRMKGTLTVE